ncbi:carbonyl reductase [NADPH] 3-like [Maniola hyperantus]|uniref:carbonyl reductase [NADPH] 3-like n=1 Tax=Aphantopus hyperantus TaxID=2795564 RepID=UPI0015697FC2|nr:carbonyl reductase [NADPH] 3-like [Maniola hyperantus]XP_034836812.1 carbonyl reductase [NADPH] 3-like [Maniola hyperantus]
MAETAVVTGANKGLGFAIVKGLCEKFQGTVYLTSRDEKRGKAACEDLKNLGYNPEYHQLDVTDDKSVAKFCSYFRSQNKKIDLLINNAGILFLKDSKEPKIYQAEQTLHVNFFALVNFTEAILPLINNKATILNITSSSGHLSRIPSEELRKKINDPNLNLEELRVFMKNYVEAVKLNREVADGWGDSPYVVSKIGVNAYTFLLNRRLADKGILVNCFHPGYVMSDMTRGAGSVTPEQAAEVALKAALQPPGGGLYVWHNGVVVPWDGPDPRGYIDGKSG